MKVLVTGATGNVGQYVASHLRKKGEEVVVATSSHTSYNSLRESNEHVVLLDFNDPSTFDRALESVDRVFLMRPPHLGDPKSLYPFIDALKKHNIQLVVFLSLMGIEKNPVPPHYKIEKYIEKSGLNHAHLRPGFFMQNLTGIHLFEINHDREIFVPAAKSKTSFVDASDVGLAAAVLLINPKKYKNTTHTITGGEALDYNQVATIISTEIKEKVRYAKPSLMAYRHKYITQRKLDPSYVNVTLALYIMTRLNTASKITEDFTKLTNQRPTSFVEFIHRNRELFTRCNS